MCFPCDLSPCQQTLLPLRLAQAKKDRRRRQAEARQQQAAEQKKLESLPDDFLSQLQAEQEDKAREVEAAAKKKKRKRKKKTGRSKAEKNRSNSANSKPLNKRVKLGGGVVVQKGKYTLVVDGVTRNSGANQRSRAQRAMLAMV